MAKNVRDLKKKEHDQILERAGFIENNTVMVDVDTVVSNLKKIKTERFLADQY